ncbi:MAG: hypothetical protein E7102_07795 [Prevotella ruminicola]|uniref:Uncharacterized protein n=1 Tax=Xylanibacter ruminicola TaxID=839 RepID=A0A928BS47_XYLRU|nr:hypothetical protein [Xylanibacter ruminicola]
MQNIKKYFMTLALLLTAVTGAWAQSTLNVVELEVPANWETDESPVTAADLTGFKAVDLNEAKAWTGAPAGNAILIYAFDDKVNLVNYANGVVGSDGKADFTKKIVFGMKSNVKFYYTAEPAEPATEPTIDVKWDAATKTGTFEMPAFDVEIAPIYAPVAQWAKVEDVDQLPTAIEGIYAESTDAIVKAGTVAKIGETENPQGTLMYAVSTSDTEQPELTAFSATLPTAKDITTAGDVYVWYYIKGADTPQEQTATAENTFNDSEICATPLKVTVLNNKFDIQFTAANDNTIETGKATVTVGGTAATVTEGKLESVKMGSEVKVKAKEGYKFRKVEVKKAGPALKTLTVKGMQLKYVEGDTWQQAIERPENEGSGWRVQSNYIFHGGYTLFINEGAYVYVRPGDTIDATKNYSLEAD